VEKNCRGDKCAPTLVRIRDPWSMGFPNAPRLNISVPPHYEDHIIHGGVVYYYLLHTAEGRHRPLRGVGWDWVPFQRQWGSDGGEQIFHSKYVLQRQ